MWSKLLCLFLIVLALVNGRTLVNSEKSSLNRNFHARQYDRNYSNDLILQSNANVDAKHHHKMSMLTLIINVVADLCPHGMLPLAYGLSKGPTGLVPAFLLLIGFGYLSSSTMLQYASLAQSTQSSSIGEIWSKVVGPKTRWVADASIFALCYGCCIFYSAFMGDIFSAVASALGVTGILSKRWVILSLLGALVVTPLCQLDDISALSFSSILGAGGIFYTFLFHIIRYFDKSYSAPNGNFYNKLSEKMKPTPLSFVTWKMNKETLILVNMLCVAYLAQYNAINYFNELENTSLARFKTAINSGFLISMAIFGSMMLIGYKLFGNIVQPLILNNFHKKEDLLATIARFATGAAITFAYPLMFAGLKSSLKNLLDAAVSSPTPTSTTTTTIPAAVTPVPSTNVISKVNQNKGKGKVTPPPPPQKSATTPPPPTPVKRIFNKTYFKYGVIPMILASITGIAFKYSEDDVSLVLGLVGSLLGCTVAYILPSYLHLKSIPYLKKLSTKYVTNKMEVLKSHIIIVIGVICSILGVWITLDSSSTPHHH